MRATCPRPNGISPCELPCGPSRSYNCLMPILHIPFAAEAQPHIQNHDLEQRVQTRVRTPETPLTQRARSREQCAPGEPRFMCTGRPEGGRNDDCCDANKPPSFLCPLLLFGCLRGRTMPEAVSLCERLMEVYTKDNSPSFRFHQSPTHIRPVPSSRSLHHTRSLAFPSSDHVHPRPLVSLPA